LQDAGIFRTKFTARLKRITTGFTCAAGEAHSRWGSAVSPGKLGQLAGSGAAPSPDCLVGVPNEPRGSIPICSRVGHF